MSQDVTEATRSSSRRIIVAVIAVTLATGAVLDVAHVRASTQVPNAGSQTPHTSGSPVSYIYTCCSVRFVNTVYHPGEVLALHWIREVNQPAQNSRYTIILKERLSGPFSSVATLKAKVAASPTRSEPVEISAPVIRISNTKAREPIPLIHIPLNAPAGYYHVSIGIYYNNTREGTEAASILRISP